MVLDWYSGAIIWKVEDGVLKFLVFWTWFTSSKYRISPAQLKFPGGKSRGHPEDSNPLDTLRREVMEELGQELGDVRINPNARPIAVHFSPSEQEVLQYPEVPMHQKIFFLLHESELVGKIRKSSKLDGGSEMGTPMWLPASGIPLYGQHRKAARRAVKMLSRTPLLLTA